MTTTTPFAWMEPRLQIALLLGEWAYTYGLDELLDAPFQTSAELEQELAEMLAKKVKENGRWMSVEEFLRISPNATLVLVPYLPSKECVDEDDQPILDLYRTFDTLAKIIFNQHIPNKGYSHWRSPYLQNPEGMKLLEGITPPKPGFRWELITFETSPGKKPFDVRNPKTSPHIGVLAAAFFNPDWVKRMDGKEGKKYHWIPGIEVFDDGQLCRVPILLFDRSARRVNLYTGSCDDAGSGWAFPASRECF